MATTTITYTATDFLMGASGPLTVGPYSIVNVATATGTDAQVTLRYFGDFDPSVADEFVNVQIEGYQSANFNGIAPNDDYTGVNEVTFTIPRADWAAIIADGTVDISYGIGQDVDDFSASYGAEEFLDISITYDTSPVQSPPSNPNPTIRGTTGDDNLAGNTSGNVIVGGVGNDTISGMMGNDQLFGNEGNDIVFGGQDNDLAYGGQGDDQVFGNMGNDVLYGNLGFDFLHGGMGNDTLYGGQDNDTLNGGQGDDVLQGGLGSDTFIFVPGQGNDIVTDFNIEEGDVLDLQGQSYALTTAGDGSAALLLSGGGVIILQGVTQAEFSDAYVA
jgi:Ca2+-binding RTX toxin-like protein